jgi:GH15 family glucan-1,4-alpha-glucosidase
LAHHDGVFSRGTVHYLNGLGQTVCDHWRKPDEGIWEGRAGRSHHTHSKVLCWVALDRLVRLHETEGFPFNVDRFRTERDAIREDVERRGYNEQIGSFTQVFEGDALDASLLTLPLYGYIDADAPRMRSTLTRIVNRLGRNGHIYRYAEDTNDGLAAGEGAFGVCGFWAVECLALRGDTGSATQAFEHLIAGANDLGLLAEETDGDTGEQLGNFPQAFTHVGVINAALTLAAQDAAQHDNLNSSKIATAGTARENA